jgi:hypothetical protein
MFKADALQAVPILDVVLAELLAQTPATGLSGANLRFAVNSLRVNAEAIVMADAVGPPLQNIFVIAVGNGISLGQMESIRGVAIAQSATLPGAILVRDSLVHYCLFSEGVITAAMDFVSRDDVEAVRQIINDAYSVSEESAADAMDQATYSVLVAGHAAIGYDLTQRAQPLPQMLMFQFAASLPTLTAAYKLYADASRADELRNQNHVIHPAFMPATGRALSA